MSKAMKYADGEEKPPQICTNCEKKTGGHWDFCSRSRGFESEREEIRESERDSTLEFTASYSSDTVDRILSIAGEALDLFSIRNRDYGDAAEELGQRAQFVDMNRKFRKLKRALWDGEELVAEQPREILMDLIGHCLLTIDMIDRGQA